MDASIQAAIRRALARSWTGACVASRVQCGQDALGASAVAEDDPGPAEPVDDARAPASGRGRRPRPVRRRCWHVRSGRRTGARPGGRCAPLAVEEAAASANQAACAARARSASVGVGHGLERERPDAVQQPVPHRRATARISGRTRVVDDHQRPARQPADHVDRRGCRHVEGFEDELHRRQGCAAGEGGQRPQSALVVGEQQVVAPRDGRPAVTDGVPACGWSGRLRTRNRSSRRRVISSTDSVLVRAAASSIARGRPSRDRHSVAHACVVGRVGAGSALCRGSAGEQLDGVGERQRGELEDDLAVDVERDLAGAQDPQPRGGIEEAHRQGSGGVEDVFAVVEDHHRGGALEPLEQRLLSARAVHGADQHVDDVAPACWRFRAWPARSPSVAKDNDVASPRPTAIATAVFPIPPGPTISTSRSPGRAGRRRPPPPSSRPTSSAAIDGRFPDRRGVRARAAGRAGTSSDGVLDQDPLLELLQLRPGVEPELVGQLVP